MNSGNFLGVDNSMFYKFGSPSATITLFQGKKTGFNKAWVSGVAKLLEDLNL